MFNFVSTSLVVLTLFGGNDGQEQPDLPLLFVNPGETYRIDSIGYPTKYHPGLSWQWKTQTLSGYLINFSCSNFDLPTFPGTQACPIDKLIIGDGDAARRYFCGRGTIQYLSKSNTLTIILNTSQSSPGGLFTCTVRAEEPPCNCGRVNRGKIRDGVPTGINEFPMMAAMIDTGRRIPMCGATVINVKQVLTAAHCLHRRTIFDTIILVGDHDLASGTDTTASRYFYVNSFYPHELYNRLTSEYDIALVELSQPIAFSDRVSPVCLPFQHRAESFARSEVDVVGWGAFEFGSGPSSVLMKAKLNVLPNDECQKDYRYLTGNHICTQKFGKDSCQFDSGGPVLWQNPETRRVALIGIISNGGICGNGGAAQNTRVSEMLQWIELKLPRGLKYCKVE